jgi:hypothetical protein
MHIMPLLPVKEVVALILVLGDIFSSAVSNGVTVYSPWHWMVVNVKDTGLCEKDYQTLLSNHQSLYTNSQVCETMSPADDCQTIIQIPSQCLLCYFIVMKLLLHVDFHYEAILVKVVSYDCTPYCHVSFQKCCCSRLFFSASFIHLWYMVCSIGWRAQVGFSCIGVLNTTL